MQHGYNSGLEKVSLTISTSLYNDESASKMMYACPDNHYLESHGVMLCQLMVNILLCNLLSLHCLMGDSFKKV